ncbi:hypothetical protein PLESTB_000482100 [Pleodorina starrii]|uniref:Uncharacterized protein n=1 Tax=Pleodorina starrii TaxID=330485 RepID=A0A9W6BGC1_9CHLO|nr:hypothetical protein PLESTM_001584300 [Pleodorina starrii]GLC51248.1 hypothetical protein PLESTB_000482100 [Pleodorina starrii]GLC63607.1 hypothetical protein PLESTF_000054500 [Pleodorina starrii]
MAASHPALAPSAGLTSAMSHIAVRRWDPVKESNDYSEHLDERRVKNQIPLPVPVLTSAYSNQDIEFSQPTNRAIIACNGLPRNFKTGGRCVNPLEPRYVLPGCSPPPSQAETAQPSPKASERTTPVTENPMAASPFTRRQGSERLLVSALSLPRGDGGGALASPKLQPLPHSPSGSHASAAAAAAASSAHHHHQQQPQQRQQAHQPSPPPPPQQSQPQQPTGQLGPNPGLNVNGAVGGLLLYGPTASSNPAAAVSVAAGNRSLDVSDINGRRRCASVPMRRNGGFDPLSVTDIVPPRKPSPTRPLACLTTSDVAGAAPRHRTRDVPSPGHGTLNSADIAGAAPGCLTRPSPTTYALGRWPAPSVPQYHFAHSTRVTMLKKPVTIGE